MIIPRPNRTRLLKFRMRLARYCSDESENDRTERKLAVILKRGHPDYNFVACL